MPELRRAVMLVGLLASPAAAQPVTFQLPVTPACISSPFGPREGAGPRASRNHMGIDIPAAAGVWVRAAAAGQVVAVRRRAGVGLEVDIRHGDGRVTRYAHLGTVAPTLATGRRRVAAGEQIGRIGRTGITYGTHLHLELIVGGERVDPAPVFGVVACRREAG